jgi:hypothetical protein
VRALGAGSAEVVLSLVSWTFHYPASAYAAAVLHILKPATGRLIVTPRPGKGQVRALQAAGFVCSQSTADKGGIAVCCVACTEDSLPKGYGAAYRGYYE